MIKAWKAFENILPQLLTIFLIVGFALAVFPQETIQKYSAPTAGSWRVLALPAVIGSVTLMPGLSRFRSRRRCSTAALGICRWLRLSPTLMMVGVVTIGIERRTVQLCVTLLRNGASAGLSLAVAVVMGW
ncbi:MAG: permease [Eubacteriales bacterium]